MSVIPPRTSVAGNGLLWINILSLDAPLVALVWQDFFASNLGWKISAASRMILGLAIWLAYAADRWLDGWKIPRGAGISARHRFAQDYRQPLGLVWLVVLFGTVTLAWVALPRYLFERGLALVLFVAIYFFINQWPGATRWLRGLKELAVGILFAAGTMIFILPSPARLSWLLWWLVACWCLLCFLNCCVIASWELEADRAARQESLLTRWPFLAPFFKYAAPLLAVFALLPILAYSFPNPARIGLAVAASSLALAGLDYWSGSIELGVLRTCADLVLLTPLVFRFFP